MSRNLRLIARLDVKAPNLVKGVQLEGLRKLGDPNAFARDYYAQGIDEILYMDIVASLYERNSLLDIIKKTTEDVFVPITVGGGIRTLEDVKMALRAGADKVAINTAALKNPTLIREVSETFGSQCMVASIEAKFNGNTFEAYYDNGREHSHRDAIEWACECEQNGAGELLITSVDREGTRKGFDINLIQAVCRHVDIPVIASGGMGTLEDLLALALQSDVDAIAMASILHYGTVSVNDIREFALNNQLKVRPHLSEKQAA